MFYDGPRMPSMFVRAACRRVAALVAAAAAVGIALPAFAQDEPPVVTGIRDQIAAGLQDDRLDVKGVIGDSLRLLLIEHGLRVMFQEKTRRELVGPFWQDYVKSVRVPRQWHDGDGWFVNYVGHPIHGAAAGFIFIHNDPKSRREEFGLSQRYWSTRWRPVAFAAIYSLQFEIGPLSEASIGNVGMNPATTGWVDYVVTPVGAMGFLVAEDALDRYFVKWVEERVYSQVLRASLRLLCGPSHMMANLAMGKLPWHRDTRSIRQRY
jgi:hypothetical protein